MVRHQAVLTDTIKHQPQFIGLPLLEDVATTEAKVLDREKSDEWVM